MCYKQKKPGKIQALVSSLFVIKLYSVREICWEIPNV